jgi:hypothetical protein
MSWWLWFLSLAVLGMLWGAFAVTFLKNPGLATFKKVVYKNLTAEKKRDYWCVECRIVMWQGVEHCEDCNVCVEELDHHCPWTSKCIAKGNLVPFYIWLCSMFSSIIYMMVVALSLLPSLDH